MEGLSYPSLYVRPINNYNRTIYGTVRKCTELLSQVSASQELARWRTIVATGDISALPARYSVPGGETAAQQASSHCQPSAAFLPFEHITTTSQYIYA
jgi:hypothetical protein